MWQACINNANLFSKYSKRHNGYFALAKNRIRKEETFLRGNNLIWETQRYPHLLKSKQNSYFDFWLCFLSKIIFAQMPMSILKVAKSKKIMKRNMVHKVRFSSNPDIVKNLNFFKIDLFFGWNKLNQKKITQRPINRPGSAGAVL